MNIGDDAAIELTKYANGPLIVAPGTFFIQETTTPVYHWNEVPETNGNPYGYAPSLLFRKSGNNPDVSQCLTYDQMNYYLDNLKAIGSYYQPYGKSIVSYYCQSTVMGGIGYWDHSHTAQVTYGIPVTSIGPPDPLPF